MSNETQVGILGALWQYKWMSAAIVAVTVLLSIGAALLVAPQASATATPRPALRTNARSGRSSPI